MVRILGTGTISTFTRNFEADYSAGSFVKFVTVSSQCTSNYGFLINSSSSQWKLDGDTVIAPETSFGVAFFGTDNEIVRSNISDTISVSSNNVIVNNTASDNFGGIFVFGSNNDIHANTTDNNSAGDGIDVIAGALGNNITGNTAENNHPFDLEDDNPTVAPTNNSTNFSTSASRSLVSSSPATSLPHPSTRSPCLRRDNNISLRLRFRAVDCQLHRTPTLQPTGEAEDHQESR
jgi:parallel beta-helix repeat protein